LGLLLRHAEHSAGRAGVQAHPDEHQDELVLEAGRPGRPQADGARSEPNAWDAWDGVRPDEAADGVHQLRDLLVDGDAGRWVVRALDDLALDAWFRQALPLARSVRVAAVAALCKPDEALSAARSFAALASVAQPQRAEPADGAYLEPLVQEAQLKLSPRALRMLAARQPQPEAAVRGARAAVLPGVEAVPLPQELMGARAAQQARRASPLPAAQPLDEQLARAPEEPPPEPLA
jgi:hypothetical protein